MRLLCALLVAFLPLASCAGAEFGEFTVTSGGEGPQVVATVAHGSTVILRLRSVREGDDAVARAQNLAARLNRLAWTGVSPEAITVEPTHAAARPGALLKAGDELLLTLDAAQAALSESQPAPLAEEWARRLRAVFRQPYVMLKTQRLQVPVGETRSFEYGGRAGDALCLECSAPEVAGARAASVGRRIEVRALSPGTGTVKLRAGETEATVEVVARPWAGQVSTPIDMQYTGPWALNPWLAQAARVAVREHIILEPGARAAIKNLTVTGAGGAALVGVAGPDCFGFERRYGLTLQHIEAAVGEPERAVLSNDPESVIEPGVLTRARLAPNETVNFLWHHVGRDAGGLEVVVRLCNRGDRTAQVHVVGADGGPCEDEVFVGHAVMQRFMKAWQAAAGSVFLVPAGERCEVSRRAMPPNQVVSGLAAITVWQGDHVFVETAAVRPTAGEDVEALPASLGGNGETSALQLPGHKTLEMRHEVGKGWGFLRIGRSPEDTSVHRRLRGDYGVLYEIGLVFDNPELQQARLEVALHADGGAARGVIEINGKLVETGLLTAGQEEIIYKQHLKGEPRKALKIRLIPQAGSNYPMTLIARSFVKAG